MPRKMRSIIKVRFGLAVRDSNQKLRTSERYSAGTPSRPIIESNQNNKQNRIDGAIGDIVDDRFDGRFASFEIS